jgi:hypothetical protein
MAGLVSAIHALPLHLMLNVSAGRRRVDGRDKPGHDGPEENACSAAAPAAVRQGAPSRHEADGSTCDGSKQGGRSGKKRGDGSRATATSLQPSAFDRVDRRHCAGSQSSAI